MGKSSATALLLLHLLSSSVANAAGARYTISDLGVLPQGNYSAANGINNAGAVVGVAGIADPVYPKQWPYAITYSGGAMRTLMALPDGRQSSATAINNAGDIVGSLVVYPSNPNSGEGHPFIWRGGVPVDIGTLPGGFSGWAEDINQAGQVAGTAEGEGRMLRAFFWENGTMTNLGVPTGAQRSEATAINDAGQVVGSSFYPGFGERAFIWDRASGMTELPTAPSSGQSLANDINNLGQVVGLIQGAPVVWENGSIRWLLLLSSRGGVATAANDQGQIIGEVLSADYALQCVMWENGMILDLQDLIPQNSGWRLEHALDINDAGQIVGCGVIGGQSHGFVLTPVPEPSGLLALLSAAGWLGGMLVCTRKTVERGG